MSRIYLGRIPYNAREKDVERFFRGFGRIRDINLKNGFGFVVSFYLDQFLPSVPNWEFNNIFLPCR